MPFRNSKLLPVDLQSFPDDLQRAAESLREAQIEYESLDHKIKYGKIKSYHRRDTLRLGLCLVAIKELEEKREGLHLGLAAKRSQFLAVATAYAQEYCQDITEKIVRSLPREIRDMVYGYLCTRISRVSVAPFERLHRSQRPFSYLERARAPAPQYNETDPRNWYINRIETPLPLLFSQKYFNREFLFELAAVVYKMATFHIWDASDVDNFLHQDLLRTGCVPSGHVRKLSLVVFTDEYGQRCASRRQIEKKLSQLDLLLNIKHREQFRLDLHLCISTMPTCPTVARFHHILLPYLHRLKDAGITIRLPLRKYYYARNRKSNGSMTNQLQSGNSRDPEDWIVDDEELEAWQESEYIRNAFKYSARVKGQHRGYDSDSDSDSDVSPDYASEELPSDFEDYDVASDEGEEEAA